jgi:hypothetical protein
MEIRPTVGDPRHQARTIEFVEWDSFAEIECPKRGKLWDRWFDDRFDEHRTWNEEFTLESVGPVVELSDRYGDFFTDVPDGTPVYVDDYEGIEFVWEDGEIVRKVDRVKLASLIGQPFFESPLRRFLIIGAGVCALAIVGWFLWRRSKRLHPS